MLSKPTVVITGAGKGIGRALAQHFYKHTYQCGLISRTQADLDSFFDQNNNDQNHLLGYCGSASNPSDVNQFVENVIQKFGKIDVLINNAGLFVSAPFLSTSADSFNEQWQTNVMSTVYMTQAVLPHMVKREKGHIIMISSVAAQTVFSNSSAYSATKGAQSIIGKTIREEYKDKNIRVTNVYPGATFTNSWSGSDVNPQRLMTAEDVAATIFNIVNIDTNLEVEEITLRPVKGDL